MYKSFRFVLFNESFPNPAKFQIRPNFGRSRISAGFVKKAGFRPEPEPNSGTALIDVELMWLYKCIHIAKALTYFDGLTLCKIHGSHVMGPECCKKQTYATYHTKHKQLNISSDIGCWCAFSECK